jgi:hypothetical protein
LGIRQGSEEFCMFKMKDSCGAIAGGGIKDLSFKLQGGCSFSEEIRSNKT